MRNKNFDPDIALSQAMELFWSKGYEASSMEDLLQVTNLSRSSFYNTFGNKREMYESVLAHFSKLSFTASQILFTGKSMQAALIDFFRLTFFSPSLTLENGCLFVNTILEQKGNDERLAGVASNTLKLIEHQFQLFFDQAMTKNELSNQISSTELAAYFMTVIKGLRVAAREGKTKTELERTFQIAIQVLQPFNNRHQHEQFI